jgi:hypothetical protein
MGNHFGKNVTPKQQYGSDTAELQWAEDSINGLFALFVFYIWLIVRALCWLVASAVYALFAGISAMFGR